MANAPTASAETIAQGDAVVTGFAGVSVSADDKTTTIDTKGAVLKIITPPGVMTDAAERNTTAVEATDPKTTISAEEIGQVFGVTLDDATPPNIYATATSAYGLQIVKDGDGDVIERVKKGGSGVRWMAGQWGGDPEAGPGSVWKIDGKTGKPSLFANLAVDGVPNTGPGLGNIAYDAKSRQLFVSDLKSGLIHRLDLKGRVLDAFDHGVNGRPAGGDEEVPMGRLRRIGPTDPAFDTTDTETWGFTDKRRMVWGVAVHDGRLFYAVADGPQIWSVGIGDGGRFANDAQLEINVEGLPSDGLISDLTFARDGTLYLAQRGQTVGSFDFTNLAQGAQSVVRRYRRDVENEAWSETPEDFAVGFLVNGQMATGGVALGPGDAAGGGCQANIWMTGEALGLKPEDQTKATTGDVPFYAGLQGGKTYGSNPTEAFAEQAVVVDITGQTKPPLRFGTVGDVAIWSPCSTEIATAEDLGPPPEPDVPGVPEVIFDPDDDWPPEPPPLPATPMLSIVNACVQPEPGAEATCSVAVRNIGDADVDGMVVVSNVAQALADGGGPLDLVSVDAGPIWTCSELPDTGLSCAIDGSALPPGGLQSFSLKIEGSDGFESCATLEPIPGEVRDYFPAESCAIGGNGDGPDTDGQPLLGVTNSCQACASGGFCRCSVTIESKNDFVPQGAITITDKATFGATERQVSLVSADNNDDWSCSTGATTAFTCTLRAGALTPGARRVVTTRIFSTGQTRKCARIEDAEDGEERIYDPQEACVDAGDDMSLTATGPATCDANANCTMTVTVTAKTPAGIKALDGRRLRDNAVVQAGGGIGSEPVIWNGPPLALEMEAGLTAKTLNIKRVIPMPSRYGLKPRPGRYIARILYLGPNGPGQLTAIHDFELRPCLPSIIPGLCISQPFSAGGAPPITPIVETCSGGRTRAGNGKCVCPSGMDWTGSRCTKPVIDPKPDKCRDGLLRAANGKCVCPRGTRMRNGRCVEPPVTCSGNLIKDRNGRCVCPAGLERIGSTSRCRPPRCSGGRYRNAEGDCVCRRGTKWTGSRCMTEPKPCSGGRYRNDAGVCVCPRGTNWQGSRCVAPPRPCSGGRYRNDAGTCVCPSGAPIWNGQRCIPRPVVCSGGQINIRGTCQCPPNRPVWRNGQCQPKVTACRATEVLRNGRCVCPTGMKRRNGICQPDFGGNKCRGGQIRQHGRCVCPPSRPVWNGSACLPGRGGGDRPPGHGGGGGGAGKPPGGGGSNCGGLNQKPCKLFKPGPACKPGLKRNFIKNRCVPR